MREGDASGTLCAGGPEWSNGREARIPWWTAVPFFMVKQNTCPTTKHEVPLGRRYHGYIPCRDVMSPVGVLSREPLCARRATSRFARTGAKG